MVRDRGVRRRSGWRSGARDGDHGTHLRFRLVERDDDVLVGQQRRRDGLGEDDAIWHADVMQTHAVLAGLGIDSTFVEFPGQGHILTEDFDETVFFEFWSSH